MQLTGSEAKYYAYNIAVRLFATNSWYHTHGQKPAVHSPSPSWRSHGTSRENTRFYSASNAPQLYERYTVLNWTLPQTELMFAHVSLHAGDWVLDAACGQ